jgi:raffinose-raffinose alpha-galactotransferase
MEEAGTPLITIAIINFNYGRYLSQAIESALGQTYPSIEVILIDDASDDDSPAVYEKYSDHIRIFAHAENQGTCFSRNEAIEKSHGDWLIFLDADNFFDCDYVEKLYQSGREASADVVYANLQNFGCDDALRIMPNFDLEALKNGNFIDAGSLILISTLGDHRFDMWLNRRSLDDYDFFLGLALAGARFIRAEGAQLNYRVHGDSRNNRANSDDQRVGYCEVYSYIAHKYAEKYPGSYSRLSGLTFAQWLVEYSHRAGGREAVLVSQVDAMKSQIDAMGSQIDGLRSQADTMEWQIEDIRSSRTYRWAHGLAGVASKLRLTRRSRQK